MERLEGAEFAFLPDRYPALRRMVLMTHLSITALSNLHDKRTLMQEFWEMKNAILSSTDEGKSINDTFILSAIVLKLRQTQSEKNVA